VSQVFLGFKAFDLHELLCHFVADRAGLYDRQGIQVQLLDSTFITPEKLPPVYFQVACGAALAEWVSGLARKVVFVATDKPMFWLHGRAAISGLGDLAGASIAGFPDIAPPAQFLRMILQEAGINPDKDVTLMSARDDVARMGLLRSGNVDAAMISSAIPPAMVQASGFNTLSMVGDHIRVPTTGLALDAKLLEENHELVAAMVVTFEQSLQLIHSDRSLLKQVLSDTFDIEECALDATSELVDQCFTPAGRSDDSVIEAILSRMATQARDSLPVDPLYDFSLLSQPDN
jgi:hypothetical protein